jgi:hypothetical protein
MYALLIALAAPVPANDAAALKKELDAAWADLIKDDKSITRGLLKFAARPKEATAYFREKLKPLKIDEKEVKKLIADLASDDEKIWKPAFETFQYFDPRLAMTLQASFDESQPGLVRGRLVMVLGDNPVETLKHYNANAIQLRSTGDDSFNFFDGTMSWWAEYQVKRLAIGIGNTNKKHWSRATRAIILLEHFATDEAIAVVQAMTTGHAEAQPTITAKESLVKLGKAPPEAKK